MPTAPGVIQGDNGQARVDSNHQVIVHAEALGNGQDDGPVAPMVEGANATVQAIGLPADDFEGRLFSADRHDPREGNWEKCACEKLDADIPAPHVRACDRRFAPQGRPKPHSAETRRTHLAVYGEPANETLSPRMLAKIDTPEARKIMVSDVPWWTRSWAISAPKSDEIV